MSEQTNDVKAKGTKKKATGPQPRRFQQKLEVALTDKEVLERTQALVAAMLDRDGLIAKKSEATSLINAEIKVSNDTIKKFAASCRSRKEERDVECYEEWIFATNTAVVYRSDTKEKVSQRTLSLEERQEPLPLLSGEPLTATVGEAVAAKATTPDGERCTSELKGVRCTRPLKHRGAHGYKDDAPKA